MTDNTMALIGQLSADYLYAFEAPKRRTLTPEEEARHEKAEKLRARAERLMEQADEIDVDIYERDPLVERMITCVTMPTTEGLAIALPKYAPLKAEDFAR